MKNHKNQMQDKLNYTFMKIKEFCNVYWLEYNSITNYNSWQEIKLLKTKQSINKALKQYILDLEKKVYWEKFLIRKFLDRQMATMQVIYKAFEDMKYLDEVRDEIIFALEQKAMADFTQQFDWALSIGFDIVWEDIEFSDIKNYYKDFWYKEVVDAYYDDKQYKETLETLINKT